MRRDMKHIIIDTGRHDDSWEQTSRKNGGRGRVRVSDVLDDDGECLEYDEPSRGKMSRGRGSKTLGDRTRPLYRWLRKQVGRPWDKIWSEVAEVSKGMGIRGVHLREHVEQYVLVRAYVEDGKLYDAESPYPSFVYRPKGRLYVCPKTKLLRHWK